MSQYKVGDVAALFSKPKEPITESGKKLQSLFKEFHTKNKKGKGLSQITGKVDDLNQGKEKTENQRVSKKEKKRKFSAVTNEDSNEVNCTKKFNKKVKIQDTNSTELKEKHIPVEQDFPRKKSSKTNKNSLKINDLNSFEDETALSDDDNQASNADFKLKNKSNDKKQVLNFIKKSKKQRQATVNGSVQRKDSVIKSDADEYFNGTLFKEDKEGFLEQTAKKQKKKRHSNDDFVQNTKSNHIRTNNGLENKTLFKKSFGDNQNSQPKLFEKGEPDFIKIPDLKSEDEEEILSRTLFVGNLPVNLKKKAIKTLFSPFGEIQHIRYFGVETDKAKIFNENHSQTLNAKNYAADSVPGFVVFCDRQSAVKALSLSGSLFKGRHITVDFALPAGTKKMYDGKRSIFIGNLPFDCQDESIWEAFSDCGRIENVRIVKDKKTGIGKGFGFIQFSTVQSKDKALDLEDLTIQGRTVRIKPADSNHSSQIKAKNSPLVKRDTFKSRAIKIKKKNKDSTSRKSVKKIMKKQKNLHNKKKVANILQKSMKMK